MSNQKIRTRKTIFELIDKIIVNMYIIKSYILL
jgi:hypothetical protein